MNQADLRAAREAFVASLLPGDRFAGGFTQQNARALTRHLSQTTNICSSRNIQLCKNCITNNILPSPGRTAALFKYLLALSKSCKPHATRPRPVDVSHESDGYEGLKIVSGQATPLNSAYRRLHIIYLLHDVLLTCHKWADGGTAPPLYRHLDLRFILGLLKDQILRLFRLAACRGEIGTDEVGPQLSKLVASWKDTKVFSDEEISSLEEVARSTGDRDWTKVLEECDLEDEHRLAKQKQAQEEATRWLLPLQHSLKDDPNAPWYELPAANGLYMKQIRGYPLRARAFPRGGFDIQNGGREADPDLQRDVKWLHKEMLHCFDEYTNPEELQDIDALGNKVWKDPERPTRNYWGFTYEGITRAKHNSRKFRESAKGYRDLGPSRSGQNAMGDVDSAVARAKALAGGRGGSDRGGWRGGRGGRGSWRGGNGYRGEFRGGRGGRY